MEFDPTKIEFVVLKKNEKVPPKNKKIDFVESCNNQRYDTTKHNYGIPAGRNGLFIVDVDIYKMEEEKEKKNIWLENFSNALESFDTFTVKTTSGGYHFYFQLTDNIKHFYSKNDSINHIDIRGLSKIQNKNEGYVVAPNMKAYNKENKLCSYDIVKQTTIKEAPKDLIKFLETYLYPEINGKKTKIQNQKIKKQKILEKKGKKVEDLYQKINKQNHSHIIEDLNMTEDIMRDNVLSELPRPYLKGYAKFLLFTTAMKFYNYETLWNNFCKNDKSNYNYQNNKEIWNSIKLNELQFNGKNIVYHLLNESQYTTYYMKKPTLKNEQAPNKVICQSSLIRRLNKDEVSYHKEDFEELFNEKHIIIKSPMNTGKTYSISQLMLYNYQDIPEEDRPYLLSIVSRQSLAKDHKRAFEEKGLPCINYLDCKTEENKKDYCLWKSNNVIISIDSLMLANQWITDFSNRIVFIDEFFSVIKHVMMSKTIKNRVSILFFLQKLFRDAKKIICVDADIADRCLDFVKWCNNNKEITYIQNTYKPMDNRNIEATEILSMEVLYNKIVREEKYLVACDSKTEVDILYTRLKEEGHNDVVKITSEDKINGGLDDYKRVIFSPSIVYGVDSQMERPIYSIYKEHTITPLEMRQQIGRCRNPTHIYFIFIGKKKHIDNFNKSYETLKNEVEKTNTAGLKEYTLISEVTGHNIGKPKELLKMITDLLYDIHCYETNKFSHFLEMLEETGIKVNKQMNKSICLDKKQRKELKDISEKRRREEFSLENCESYQNINKSYFEFEESEIKNNDDFMDLFLNPNTTLQYYLNYIKTNYSTTYLQNKLTKKDELVYHKINSNDDFLIKLKLFKSLTGNNSINDLQCKNGIAEKDSTTFLLNTIIEMNYKTIKNKNEKRIELQKSLVKAEVCHKEQVKMYKRLFGDGCIISTQKEEKMVNGVRGDKITTYKINEPYFENFENIFCCAKKGKCLQNNNDKQHQYAVVRQIIRYWNTHKSNFYCNKQKKETEEKNKLYKKNLKEKSQKAMLNLKPNQTSICSFFEEETNGFP